MDDLLSADFLFIYLFCGQTHPHTEERENEGNGHMGDCYDGFCLMEGLWEMHNYRNYIFHLLSLNFSISPCCHCAWHV